MWPEGEGKERDVKMVSNDTGLDKTYLKRQARGILVSYGAQKIPRSCFTQTRQTSRK